MSNPVNLKLIQQKGSAYFEPINAKLHSMFESGLIDTWISDLVANFSNCDNKAKGRYTYDICKLLGFFYFYVLNIRKKHPLPPSAWMSYVFPPPQDLVLPHKDAARAAHPCRDAALLHHHNPRPRRVSRSIVGWGYCQGKAWPHEEVGSDEERAHEDSRVVFKDARNNSIGKRNIRASRRPETRRKIRKNYKINVGTRYINVNL